MNWLSWGAANYNVAGCLRYGQYLRRKTNVAENIKRKMLVVDDEEVNRAVIGAIFEDLFDVTEASSGEEAIKIVEGTEDISILLLDIVMPGLSGYDVLSFLKKGGYLQKFPTVVISSLDDVQSRGKLYDLGASDIITKPFVPDVVSQRVGSVLDFFSKRFSDTDERRGLLIADDMEMNRAVISEIFYKDYEIFEAKDGQEAMDMLEQNGDKLAAVILDVIMPRKTGFDVIEFMRDKNYLENVPVVFITAMEKPENELRIWNLGASDVISKPFLPHIVKKRVENVVSLYRQKRKMSQMLEYLERKQDFFNNELVDVLSSIIEYRSLESGKHIQRIRQFSRILLTELVKQSPDFFLDNETILTIADATAMHDIGKISIPDTVLSKPGRLTKEEFEVIKQHPAVGSQILSRLLGSDMNEYMRYAYDVCRYHHERWDGKGYPDGLMG
ncbi:MAG: response regulator, partial [Firmicutes bacterium]|nr:response regulator [Bacillota bacterium]